MSVIVEYSKRVNQLSKSVMSVYPQFIQSSTDANMDYTKTPAFFMIMPACDPVELFAAACISMETSDSVVEIIVIDQKIGQDIQLVSELLHQKYNGRFHLVRPNQD